MYITRVQNSSNDHYSHGRYSHAASQAILSVGVQLWTIEQPETQHG